MTADPTLYRLAWRRFPTGVSVVTTRSPDGAPYATTANALLSVSLDPPLLLLSVATSGHTCDYLRHEGCFGVNFLRGDQADVADFYGRGRAGGAQDAPPRRTRRTRAASRCWTMRSWAWSAISSSRWRLATTRCSSRRSSTLRYGMAARSSSTRGSTAAPGNAALHLPVGEAHPARRREDRHVVDHDAGLPSATPAAATQLRDSPVPLPMPVYMPVPPSTHRAVAGP